MIREFLRHGSNAVLILAVLSLCMAASLGKVSLLPWWLLGGIILFQLSEYSFHRFLFHARPSKYRWLLRLQHRLHYDHHIEPGRLDLLFLPLWFAVPNLAVTGLIAWAISGEAAAALSLVLGSMLALLHY